MLQIAAVLLRIMTILITSYCKIITNYDKNLLEITATLLQITAVDYYKFDSFITNYSKKLLQITAALIFAKFKIITNYVKFHCKLRQLLVLLTITANVITNFGRYYKLRRSYKLRRNSLFHQTLFRLQYKPRDKINFVNCIDQTFSQFNILEIENCYLLGNL